MQGWLDHRTLLPTHTPVISSLDLTRISITWLTSPLDLTFSVSVMSWHFRLSSSLSARRRSWKPQGVECCRIEQQHMQNRALQPLIVDVPQSVHAPVHRLPQRCVGACSMPKQVSASLAGHTKSGKTQELCTMSHCLCPFPLCLLSCLLCCSWRLLGTKTQ